MLRTVYLPAESGNRALPVASLLADGLSDVNFADGVEFIEVEVLQPKRPRVAMRGKKSLIPEDFMASIRVRQGTASLMISNSDFV
jgi:hypothetical protein